MGGVWVKTHLSDLFTHRTACGREVVTFLLTTDDPDKVSCLTCRGTGRYFAESYWKNRGPVREIVERP
jgi:hypothetical protein